MGVVSAGLLASLFAAGLWSHDDGVDPAASTSASGGTAPGVGSQSSPGTAQLPTVPGQSRLRNAGADLCLDITGTVKAGAGTDLAACSDADTQQWSFDKDGLLRSAADPDLCLDSHLDAGVAVLGRCAAEKDKRGADVRYDPTVQGELLPRWDERLALAAAAEEPGADVVAKARDGSPAQRWVADPSATVTATPGSLSITRTGLPAARPARLSQSA